jgi:3-hydroxyisobutyrate dehydrogenase
MRQGKILLNAAYDYTSISTRSPTMKIVFIGVGNMGKPMAANLVKGGHEVLVHDAVSSLTSSVAEEIGAIALRQISEVAAAEMIITMLPDGKVVRDVALREGGAGAWAKPGTIWVDMSSSQPMITRETGAALAKKQIVLVDAPVSGGVPRATSGTLTIMIGGDDPAAIAKAKSVLTSMGKALFEVGKLGAGHTAKALNNVVAACNYAVLAEALQIAELYGIDPETMVDIFNVSTGQSFSSTVVMKNFVVPKTFNTGFAIGLLAKDANIAAELSEELGCAAPHVRLTSKRWAEARDWLGAGEDNSKAIVAWQKIDGV